MSASLRLITYNVHRCVGFDGRLSPSRVAEVLSNYTPDVVALQELDVGNARTLGLDQPQRIAELLEMKFHFHPSFRVGEGAYGNAVLSRHPMEVVRAGGLPSPLRPPGLERRGAMWVRIEIGGRVVQVVNTHLGLNPYERLLQAERLLGPEWLGAADCEPPVLLCGDFNAAPGSATYERLAAVLVDAVRTAPIRCGTWPTIFPVWRIDHVFVRGTVEVRRVHVPRTPLTRVASDHLPVVVSAEVP